MQRKCCLWCSPPKPVADFSVLLVCIFWNAMFQFRFLKRCKAHFNGVGTVLKHWPVTPARSVVLTRGWGLLQPLKGQQWDDNTCQWGKQLPTASPSGLQRPWLLFVLCDQSSFALINPVKKRWDPDCNKIDLTMGWSKAKPKTAC